MSYKLLYNSTFILKLPENISFPASEDNRFYRDYLVWLAEDVANLPLPADEPTVEQLAKNEEVKQAPITAREYFAPKPAAITFIRLTPVEQEAAIDGYTLTQLKVVVKYLSIAVSMLVKERLL